MILERHEWQSRALFLDRTDKKISPEDLKVTCLKGTIHGNLQYGVPIEVGMKPQLWTFTERCVVRKIPIMTEDEHHFETQGANHYQTHVANGTVTRGLESTTSKYQPVKKSVQIYTEKELKNKVEAEYQWTGLAVGI